MKLLSTLLLITIFPLSGMTAVAQAAAPASSPAITQSAAVSPAAAAAANTPSGILQPALTNLQEALDAQHTDKWKVAARLRDDTDANIRSIRRDLDTGLPPLLGEADKAPDSVASGLPVLRNIEALYDVLLRVGVVGKVSAPAPQSAALEQAMSKLDDARRALGDRLQTLAVAREKQVNDLQAALRAVPSPPPPAPVVAATPPPEKKRPRKKAVPKPTPAAAPVAPASQ